MDLALLQRARALMDMQPQAQEQLQTPPQFQSSEDVSAPLPSPSINVNDRMNQLYNPSNTAATNLTGALSRMPQRSSYAPSGLQRVLATVAGAGSRSPAEAFDTSRGIINRPYDEAMSGFSNTIKPAEYAAQLEQTKNKENITFAEQTIQKEINEKKAETDEKRQKAQQKSYEDRANIAQQRADTYKFKSEHPNWVHVVDDSGNLQFVNPEDPSKTYNSGISMTTPQEKNEWQVAGRMKEIQANIKGRLDEIAAQGNESRTTEDTKAANRINLKVTPPPPKPAVNKPLLPSQQAIADSELLRRIRQENPDVESVIALGKDKKYNLAPPGMVSGITGYQDKYNKTLSLIKVYKALTDAKQPITPANVNHLMSQLGGK